MGPFVAAAPELVEENGKNKEEGRGRKKIKDGEKRAEEVAVQEVEERRRGVEREGKQLMLALKVSPVVAAAA